MQLPLLFHSAIPYIKVVSRLQLIEGKRDVMRSISEEWLRLGVCWKAK